MQWIYLICFILLSAGLLALFGVKPGDFIDALFRSQRKSATLSDELNVLLGTPAKGFFNQDYELKQILKGTGRADRYEAIKRLSLILFAVGAVLALLIGNVYMVPILGIGFSLIPIWYLRSTATSYKKHLNTPRRPDYFRPNAGSPEKRVRLSKFQPARHNADKRNNHKPP